MLEDRRRPRRRLQMRLSATRMLGTVGTTRVLPKQGSRTLATRALWCTTRRVWVRPRRQREARPVTPARRLEGKRCVVVRVRRMRPRRQVWLLVRRWWLREDRLRRRLVLRHRRQRLRAPRPRRRLRLRVRVLELRCCRVEAARRRLHMRRVQRLAPRVGQRQRRRMRRVRPWSVVVDPQRRRAPRQLRQLAVVVQVRRRRRLQRARLRVRRWLLTGDRHLRWVRQQWRRPRVREHLLSRRL